MPSIKTPGVYTVEKNAFPSSIVEVPSAVPAFIGYTKVAQNGKQTLAHKPWRISSMAEYETYFGGAPSPRFNLENQGKSITQTSEKFILFYSIKLFFQNGGGPCYIVSVGNYDDEDRGKERKGNGSIQKSDLLAGIALLEKEREPTMVVIPEAVSLKSKDDCVSLQLSALRHCGGKMRNRISILDVFEGYKARQDHSGQTDDCIDFFRGSVGNAYLDYATAYYPWVNTTIVQESEITFNNLTAKGKEALRDMLTTELKVNVTADLPRAGSPQAIAKTGYTKHGQAMLDQRKAYGELISGIVEFTETVASVKQETELADKSATEVEAATLSKRALLHKELCSISPLYRQLIKSITAKLNVLPPAAAMAGIYTTVDNSRGVWKAPANLSIASVTSPTVQISHEEQEDLTVSAQGLSINAIRSFVGEGTLVWGARTLDGNSMDWRYISVRRTIIMMEESIRWGIKAYVFEPNNEQTWITIKSIIGNYLTSIWKSGGLAGASPDEAFNVRIGLNETMTQKDILEGIMQVSILVALVRPAEFMEMSFSQKMQKS